MVEELELALKVDSSEDILSLLEQLAKMGKRAMAKTEHGDQCEEVYHVEGSTVVASHNAPETSYFETFSYHLEIKVYGTPSEKLKNWLEEHKEQEEPEEPS